jgi:hypothetical protein
MKSQKNMNELGLPAFLANIKRAEDLNFAEEIDIVRCYTEYS